MRQSERSMCRPGGFALTERLIKMAGIGGRETLRVVDVGCGEGATIGYLRELHPGWEVSGIDADPAFCAAGMTETGRAESLPFPDGSIDVILMECSLSKTEQPERAAAEAFRVLKTGGWQSAICTPAAGRSCPTGAGCWGGWKARTVSGNA